MIRKRSKTVAEMLRTGNLPRAPRVEGCMNLGYLQTERAKRTNNMKHTPETLSLVGGKRNAHWRTQCGRYETRYLSGDRKSGFQYWFDTQSQSPFGGFMGNGAYWYVFPTEAGRKDAADKLERLLLNR